MWSDFQYCGSILFSTWLQKLVHFSGVMVLNPFIIKSFTSLVLNGQTVYQLFKTSWIFSLIWHSHVTEISITTDRKEQVRLFIIMAASFTYNLIKLVLGPMQIFFIIWIISLTTFSQICIKQCVPKMLNRAIESKSLIFKYFVPLFSVTKQTIAVTQMFICAMLCHFMSWKF